MSEHSRQTRWTHSTRVRYPLLATALWAGACAFLGCEETTETEVDLAEVESELVSVHTKALVGTIAEGKVVAPDLDTTSAAEEIKGFISRQLRYTVGFFNGRGGAPMFTKLEISAFAKLKALEGGLAEYTYTAKLPIAYDDLFTWPASIPDKVYAILPLRVDDTGLADFLSRYKRDCTDGVNTVPVVETYWYYYRPEASYCKFLGRTDTTGLDNAAGISIALAPGQMSQTETFPEYDKIWADGKLVVTVVFTLLNGDFGELGEEGYNMMFRQLVWELGKPLTINDPSLIDSRGQPLQPNAAKPVLHLEWPAQRGTLEVHMFLLKSLDTPSHRAGDGLESFRADYDALAERSDFVAYNGHAHYGDNIAKFEAMGKWKAGQYQIFLLNACDTYVYGADKLREAHRAANAGGSRPDAFFDLITNAIPARPTEIPFVNLEYVRALLGATLSYKQILERINRSQKMVVLYDEDNGQAVNPEEPAWPGMEERGTVNRAEEKRYSTPALKPGIYVFETTGQGDADLYVRVGDTPPTTKLFDCRPYKPGTAERCVIELPQQKPIHIMVRGFASRASEFTLKGRVGAATDKADTLEEKKGEDDESTCGATDSTESGCSFVPRSATPSLLSSLVAVLASN